MMKQSLIKIAFVLGTIFAFSLVAAHAAPAQKTAKTAKKTQTVKKSKKSSHASVGDALRRKKYLVMESRTVESLNSGNFDSTLLDDGNGKGSKRLYSLPRDFAYRATDEGQEMRYRQ